ncbi:hypothetical protein IZ6_13760 [Terrihabitans soli]|uniref:Uncharacterized protein n=1 Tax=Terrihabitans soli TaxID=708113 RepID=A0A6S6QU90_9HYPH|nr:hypothetical protein [Terrihabitans soli]BCJ90641.1 hypothetical protein IZ6_13760 [Terrihabitans soli]
MRVFEHNFPPKAVSGRMGLVLYHKDGRAERVDLGVVKEGFYAPIPGDEVVHDGVHYEVAGVADSPESDVSIAVIAEEK